MSKILKHLFLVFTIISAAEQSLELGPCPICREDLETLQNSQSGLVRFNDLLGCRCTAICCQSCANNLEQREIDRCPVCRSYTVWAGSELCGRLFRLIYQHEPAGEYEFLISQLGRIPTTTDDTGNSLLHAAVDTNQNSWASYLAALIPINAVNTRGESPLHLTRSHQIFNLLRDNGADIEATTQWGSTPLHMSTFHGRYMVVRGLLRAGANIHCVNEDGQTPLHLSRISIITRELLNFGANKKAKDYKENFPLHTVLHHGCQDLDCIKQLVDPETIVGINDFNEKPLDIALRRYQANSPILSYLHEKSITSQ